MAQLSTLSVAVLLQSGESADWPDKVYSSTQTLQLFHFRRPGGRLAEHPKKERAELDRWEQEKIQEALAWLSRRRKADLLDVKFICQLHDKMFNKVWRWSGSFRRSDKNIGVNWSRVPVELRQLMNDTKAWVEYEAYPADEIAFRFHHRLVWIHLFPNGNGRHARLMTDVLLTELLGQDVFTWGNDDLSNSSIVRKHYITALKAADEHDYTLLREFVRS